MKKSLKLFSALLALVGVVMMFFTQVTVKWYSGHSENIAIQALVGGKYSTIGTQFNGVGTGLAGYILLGVGALILLLVALVPFFKEHDVLAMVVTGLALVCFIIGIVFLFLIRKNFADANGFESEKVFVGWAAIAAGSLGGLAILFGGVSLLFDLAGNN